MESLFNHLVVPLDFTEKNAAAMQIAHSLATQNRSRVTLLHVIETINGSEDQSVTDFYDALKSDATKQMAERAASFANSAVLLQQEIVLGKPASAIVEYVVREQADLVVLSSHPVTLDQSPKGWATISYQVSLLCPCPVMLVK